MPRRAVVNKTSFQTLTKDLREGGYMNGGDTWDKDIPLLTNGPVLPLASHDAAYYGFERSLYTTVKPTSAQENKDDKKYGALLAKQLQSLKSKLKENDRKFEEEHFSDKPPTKEFMVNNDNEITKVRLGHRIYQVTKVCIPLVKMNEKNVFNLSRQSMKSRKKSSKIKGMQNSISLHCLVSQWDVRLVGRPNWPKQNKTGDKSEKQKLKSRAKNIVSNYYEATELKIAKTSVGQRQMEETVEKQVSVVETEPVIYSNNLDATTIDEILGISTSIEEEQQQIIRLTYHSAKEINNTETFDTNAFNNLPSAIVARTKIQSNVCVNEKVGCDAGSDQDILELYADTDDDFGIE